MAEEIKFKLEIGTFEKDKFVWKTLKSFSDITKAKKAFRKFCLEQFYYTDEELFKVWKSVRIDVELKQENKLLNWCGIYFRVKESKYTSEDSVIHDESKALMTRQYELLNSGQCTVGPRVDD